MTELSLARYAEAYAHRCVLGEAAFPKAAARLGITVEAFDRAHRAHAHKLSEDLGRGRPQDLLEFARVFARVERALRLTGCKVSSVRPLADLDRAAQPSEARAPKGVRPLPREDFVIQAAPSAAVAVPSYLLENARAAQPLPTTPVATPMAPPPSPPVLDGTPEGADEEATLGPSAARILAAAVAVEQAAPALPFQAGPAQLPPSPPPPTTPNAGTGTALHTGGPGAPATPFERPTDAEIRAAALCAAELQANAGPRAEVLARHGLTEQSKADLDRRLFTLMARDPEVMRVWNEARKRG